MGRTRNDRRRVSAAVVLSALVRQRKIEIRLARALEEPFLRILEAARSAASRLESAEAFLTRVNAAIDERRTETRDVVRKSGEASAKRGYDRTLMDLRKLGVHPPETTTDEAMSDTALYEMRLRLNDETYRQLDVLPARILKATEFLLSKRSLRPWAKKLARGLAKAASTYAEVRGELAANEDHGTGWWEWYNRGDERVRGSHRDKPIGVGREVRQVGVLFSNGCRYPRDPFAPIAETAGCRCGTRPVLPPTGGSGSAEPPGNSRGGDRDENERIPYEAAGRIAEHAISNDHEIPGLGDIKNPAARRAYAEYVYDVGKRINPHKFADGTMLFYDSDKDAVVFYNSSARYNEGTVFVPDEGGLRYYFRMQSEGRIPRW